MPSHASRKTGKKTGSGFAAAFFSNIPGTDRSGWSDAALAEAAASMEELAAQRKPGMPALRVRNADFGGAGGSGIHAVVEIVNDDMPFIIDSISADLAARALQIETLFHPVLDVSRDSRGKMTAAQARRPGQDGVNAESFVYIRLEGALSAGQKTETEASLRAVLDNVRAATSDWLEMLGRMDEIVSVLPRLAETHDAADVAEAEAFLAYLRANNFTFLGYCTYRFGGKGGAEARCVPGSGLGIMRDAEGYDDLPEMGALRAGLEPVLVSKMFDRLSPVHRRVPMDAVSVRIVDREGRVSGMHLFVGLFTSSTYSCRTGEVPIVRRKVRATVARAGFPRGSHDQKALEHVLEKMPRDELFQVTGDELYALSLGILRLQEKHAIALFAHRDPLRPCMSCLVYVPRDRYNTRFRLRAGQVLESALGGRVANYFTTLDDSPLARLLLTVHLENGAADFDRWETERRLVELGREWDERLRYVLIEAFGKTKGLDLSAVYGRAFGRAYHDSIDINNAPHDIRHLEALLAGDEGVRVDLYRLQDAPAGDLRLKVYHKGAPVSLSDIMPVLENMGLHGLSETPYAVRPADRPCAVWIHDFHLRGGDDVDLDAVKAKFEDAFMQVWHGRAESDGFNQLILRAGLEWHEVRILRAYGGFMRQARFPYSSSYMEKVLAEHASVAGRLVALFKALHDPRRKDGKAAAAISAAIDEDLRQVGQIDHDRILRGFRTLVERTLRTNYWQRDVQGRPKPCLSMKMDSRNIPDLPLPRPHVEIYVYSARVEGVHLRGGEIARGGIRWSDRRDDLRTEILGLMKAQMVKNAVIVPVGAKGGFIVKRPPPASDREAFRREGVECYKLLVQSMLDITDNNVKGKIVRPKDVVCHDGPDPYLVVAADKGTAKFSDTANALALEAGFWLGDAFASGGSAGYDHKEMGITARGGWESVTRHFREMGKDIAKEPFTVIGVGDMGGDVFGNAMLLSRQIRLVGAFNHVHIFCDPDPDPRTSHAERRRLFHAQGGWDAYDASRLSPGGAVFDRSAKALKLSPQIRKRFGLDRETVTPDELVRAILCAEAELMWFGGIGNFVKGAHETHAAADDKANDGLRVDARDLRVKVIGEGANLAVTQAGRVEFARRGGRVNTDFIDNSGGVDCSDHEVNIKILLGGVMAQGKMTLKRRDALLRAMTEEVAELVLRDNRHQNQSLSLQQLTAREDLALHAELIHAYERAGFISRRLEGLPDDETLARLARDGGGLTRPELCILTSWAKIALMKDVAASDIPDDPALEGLLFDYFPAALHRHGAEIRGHKLRRQIVATQIVNILVNRMGPVFIHSRMQKTGAAARDIVRAFVIVAEAFGLRDLWRALESLDGKVPAEVQTAAHHEVFKLCKRAVTWLLRFNAGGLDIGAEIAAFAPGIAALKNAVHEVITPGVAESLEKRRALLAERGLPGQVAADISVLRLLSSACDIISIARRSRADVKTIASVYFLVGERMHIDWIRAEAAALSPANAWQARILSGLVDDYYMHQAVLSERILREGGTGGNRRRQADAWFADHQGVVARLDQTMNEIRSQPRADIDMLVLAGQRLGQIVSRLS